MASGQPGVQTFVLRVSIHCQGCKKKVRKVLRGIEGVHDVKVDAQQHRVTVTGTVDAQTLIQRLQKSGKQALQWQNLHAAPAKDPEPRPAPAPPAEDGGKDNAAADKKPEEAVKAESAEKKPEQDAAASEKKPEQEAEKETDQSEKKAEKEEAKPSDESKKDGGDSEAAEVKAKGAEPAAEKEAGNDESEAKEKKQSKPKDVAAAEPIAAAAAAVDRSLPRQAQQEYSPYYAPQPVMSYHMAQPKASVSYYAPRPEQGYSMQQQPPQAQPGYSSMMQPQEAYSQQSQPMQQWSPSYLYMPYPHASPESYYQDYYSPPGTHAPMPAPPPPLQDSYRLFDDENPNSCSVM